MKVVFDTHYTNEEREFLNAHSCEILPEIKLSKVDFSKEEIPRRMFCYGGTYVGEIVDDECKELCWGILSKWKGEYRFTSVYMSLEDLEQGL